jgi:hypothetical protein
MRSSKAKGWQNDFLREMQKDSPESWLSCKELLAQILKEEPELSRSFQYDIDLYARDIGHLLTLLLVYHHKVSVAGYKLADRLESLSKGEHYHNITEWTLSQPRKVQEEATELVLEIFPLLLKEARSLKIKDLEFLLTTFNRLQVRRERDLDIVVSCLGRMQQLISSCIDLPGETYETKELAIMQLCC